MDEATALVQFQGARLLTAAIDGVPHVAMAPIVEHLGLDWSAQYRRIMRHEALKTCVVIMATRLPGDPRKREVLMLPIGMLSGWLFGVRTSMVRHELRDRLLAYQRESFAVLDSYWRRGIAINPRLRTIEDREGFQDDKHLYPRQRFAIERERWERETGYTLAKALGTSPARIKGLENGDKALLREKLWLHFMGLGLDVNYIYRGERTLAGAERDVMRIMRSLDPAGRRAIVAMAETMPAPDTDRLLVAPAVEDDDD
jgi:hypothetical protein